MSRSRSTNTPNKKQNHLSLTKQSKPHLVMSLSQPRKRRRQQKDREKLQQYGIDLPDIPGMAVTVIPLHVLAQRKTRIFFRKDMAETCVKPFLTKTADEDSVSNTSLQTNQVRAAAEDTPQQTRDGNVVATLLHRVEQAAASETRNSEAERERKMRLDEYQNAIQSWLEALRREMRDAKNSTVVLAAAEHLWEFLLNDEEKISIRRTCLHLCGHLLEKSADLRRWFLEESSRLGKWTESIVNTQKETNAAYQLFQREGFLLLQHLDTMGFAELYPRLRVAMQRLQQQFPWIAQEASSSSTVVTHLPEMRQIRDAALKHWPKERAIVRRLLDRSDVCMRILVPRLGEEAPPPDAKTPRQEGVNTADDNGEDDDDEDIDWEDGIVDEDVEAQAEDQQEESHVDAVERTLAVMQSSARMRAGQLEINFDATTAEQTAVTPQMVEAKERLAKCVKKLRNRHVERLSIWIDALTHADDLTQGESGSLVQMTPETRQKRRETLQEALRLKADVNSCLSSSQRLVAESSQSEAAINKTSAVARPAAPLNFHTAPRNERLATTLNRSKPQSMDHTRKRSAKIHIKYAK